MEIYAYQVGVADLLVGCVTEVTNAILAVFQMLTKLAVEKFFPSETKHNNRSTTNKDA
jgi:hypothetical protein